MTKQKARNEIYNWYSDWHRQYCKSNSYMMDIDAVEYRYVNGKPKIIALFEIKSDKADYDEDKLQLVRQMAIGVGAKAYYVKYYAGKASFNLNFLADDTRFDVYDLINNVLVSRNIPESVYRKWVDSLN